MKTFRRRSVTPKPAEALQPQKPSIVIRSQDYVLENLEAIKFAFYQNDKLVLGKEVAASLVLFFPDNSRVQMSPSLIHCFVTSSNYPTEHIECIVQDTQSPGQYTVTFTPQARGTSQLYIKLNHTDITRYSLNAPVSISPLSRSTPTNTFVRFKYPYAIVIVDNDSMIVSEYFSHRLKVLDKDGRFIRFIGSHGKERGKFHHPSGLALSTKGNLLVVDRDNHRIQELKLNGECVSCVGRKGSKDLQFNTPEGIAVCPSTGMIYIADCYNHRVQVLKPDLTFSHIIGGLGKAPGQFKHPFDLTFDRRGFIYVTDRCNDRIQRITPDSQKCDVINNQLDGPTGITIDDHDILYVCEYGVDLIAAITTEGEFVPCELQGRCKGPYGIKFNPFNGDIIACDTRNNRLLVF